MFLGLTRGLNATIVILDFNPEGAAIHKDLDRPRAAADDTKTCHGNGTATEGDGEPEQVEAKDASLEFTQHHDIGGA